MKKTVLLAGVGLVLLGIQLVPVERSNPPVESELAAPPAVKAVLRRSCYDCHSHETVWPWYSRVAPSSWLTAHNVKEGRENLNFSRWEADHTDDVADTKRAIIKMLRRDEMPPWEYLLLHPKARLSEEDRKVLLDWAGK